MQTTGRCRFGLYEFDFRTAELRREGALVKLAPQPARLLGLLLAKPGELVLRDELRAHLWNQETFVDFERGLNFCILQVRTALGDASENPRFIQTVPRKGYRFIAPVEKPSSPRGTFPPPLATISSASFDAASVMRRRFATFAVATVVILAPVGWLLMRSPPPNPTADSRVRVAILPFQDLTGDRSDDYIVDGLTDELIAQLGRVSPQRLGVIARTSVMRYRNAERTVADIARDLNVRYVVEGSVRRDGPRIRATTELIKVSDETQVWSDAFEGAITETMDFQTKIASRIARALTLELVAGAADPAFPRATTQADAWDAYLRGRYLLNRGSGDDVKRAIEQFETAVRLDPAFAGGWAALAEAQHVLVMVGAIAPRDAYPRAIEAAGRGLALDSTLADAHVANGLVQLWYDWRPLEAARSFERALAINPSHAAARHDYAWSLVALDRFDEAIRQITMTRDLDPLSTRANTDIGWLYLHLRQPTEAERACRHTLVIQPDALEAQACLERAFTQRGMYEEASRAAQSSLSKDADVVLATAAPDQNAIQAIWRWRLRRLEEASRTRWVSPYTLAVHLIFLGEHDRAIAQLELGFEQRVGVLAFIKTDPALDPLRSLPRFQTLVSKVTQRTR